MPTLFGLALASILLVAFIRYELRTAWCGIVLSNGVDVLVSARSYEEIVHRFETSDEPDERERWDQAVLDVLHADRPYEWEFLAQTLVWQVPARGRQEELCMQDW